MNELDQHIKHRLKTTYYLRYADDFVIVSAKKESLAKHIKPLADFLGDNLKLKFHPNKIIFRKLDWGVDFLGYISLPHYRLPRTKTRRRILKKVLKIPVFNQTLQSYLGYFSQANSFKLSQNLKNIFYLTQSIQQSSYRQP